MMVDMEESNYSPTTPPLPKKKKKAIKTTQWLLVFGDQIAGILFGWWNLAQHGFNKHL